MEFPLCGFCLHTKNAKYISHRTFLWPILRPRDSFYIKNCYRYDKIYFLKRFTNFLLIVHTHKCEVSCGLTFI